MRVLSSYLVWTAVFFSFQSASAQNEPTLETILNEAQKQTAVYREAFQNLLADELKTFQEFDERGGLKRSTVVKSSFLVYRSGKNGGSTAEMRNVLEVNGRAVPDSAKRGERFLAELEKEKTFEKELKKLQSEGSKYDKTWEIYGLTLNKGIILAPNLRPFFEFTLIGKENYTDAEVFRIDYRQTKSSPFVSINSKPLKSDEAALNFEVEISGTLKKQDLRLQGSFLIDTKSFRIWREERNLVSQTDPQAALLSTIFEYQPSEFGVFVPLRITLNFNKFKNKLPLSPIRTESVKFEYSNFRRTNVEIRISDDEESP